MSQNQDEGNNNVNLGPHSPSSFRSKHSQSYTPNRSFSVLQFTSMQKSPNVSLGPRPYFNTPNQLEIGNSSQLRNRNQNWALGSLGSLPEENKRDNANGVYAQTALQSNLSLLLQKESKNPDPNSTVQPSPSIVLDTSSVQIDNSKKPDVTKPRINNEDIPTDDSEIETGGMENRPLLNNQLGFNNYGNVIIENDNYYPQGKISWINWIPYVGVHNYSQYERISRPSIHITPKKFIRHIVLDPISYIPAVILGLLLNLLDAISYGLIIFPLSNPIFENFGPDGISIFFISCIVSQIVYSGGGSVFRGGNGSMMIEVVPFLHLMAETISSQIDENTEDREKAVIATTILSFALSSILTGVVFLLLGIFRLGSLVEYFPRHILIGCIGGVGWFLFATAIEVTSRIQEFRFDLETLILLLSENKPLLCGSALALAIFLRFIQSRLNYSLVVPLYFMIIPIIFYAIVYIFGLDWQELRDDGWVFNISLDNDTPWYNFYNHFGKDKTNWNAILKTVPAMFALTFFGILHVPINVPALGVSLEEDNVDTNRELIAHGFSNMISGFCGSVQNYLVYTNSLLFIQSGGDSRVAGLMLAAGTFIILIVGPWIVAYVPVMAVGALIFHLGLELMKEALVDSWEIVNSLEYFTIVATAVFMATLGFIEVLKSHIMQTQKNVSFNTSRSFAQFIFKIIVTPTT
nr:1987_t:CDS:10 [Entrophospora candida]